MQKFRRKNNIDSLLMIPTVQYKEALESHIVVRPSGTKDYIPPAGPYIMSFSCAVTPIYRVITLRFQRNYQTHPPYFRFIVPYFFSHLV